MEKPTIISSGPDAMGRTVCLSDEMSRQARYGRIRPMPTRGSLFNSLTRWVAGD
jgi:hypothetical protein